MDSSEDGRLLAQKRFTLPFMCRPQDSDMEGTVLGALAEEEGYARNSEKRPEFWTGMTIF